VREAHGSIKPGVQRAQRANPRTASNNVLAREAGDGLWASEPNRARPQLSTLRLIQPPPAPRASIYFFSCPGVCSLRSLHPRLYAAVRSADCYSSLNDFVTFDRDSVIGHVDTLGK